MNYLRLLAWGSCRILRGSVFDIGRYRIILQFLAMGRFSRWIGWRLELFYYSRRYFVFERDTALCDIIGPSYPI